MFSTSNYKILLESITKRGYRMVPLSSYTAGLKGPMVLLRFDVDYSPSIALEVAEINAESGVVGTFFFLMDSPLYNLCSRDSQKVLGRLGELNQEVGWHVTYLPGETTSDTLVKSWGLFQRIVPWAVPLLAWHNPDDGLLGEANKTARSTGLLMPVYDEPFISEEVRYLSDSNRRNNFVDLMNLLNPELHPRVQLLLHPLNWVIGGNNISDILSGAWDNLLKDMDMEFSENPNWRRRTGS